MNVVPYEVYQQRAVDEATSRGLVYGSKEWELDGVLRMLKSDIDYLKELEEMGQLNEISPNREFFDDRIAASRKWAQRLQDDIRRAAENKHPTVG